MLVYEMLDMSGWGDTGRYHHAQGMLPVTGPGAKYFQLTRRGDISLYYHTLRCLIAIAILVLSKQNKTRQEQINK